MKPNEIQDIIRQVVKSGVDEVVIENSGCKLRIVRVTKNNEKPLDETQSFIQNVTSHASALEPLVSERVQEIVEPILIADNKAETVESSWIGIKSPMIGTFYASPSPDKPAFVTVGSNISIGDPVCIIEAMKLFNEIESEISGKVMKVLVKEGDAIEHGKPLMLIEPN